MDRKALEHWLELYEDMIPDEDFTGPQRSTNRSKKCEYFDNKIKDIEYEHKEL